MKECPLCSEEMEDEAIECEHCGGVVVSDHWRVFCVRYSRLPWKSQKRELDALTERQKADFQTAWSALDWDELRKWRHFGHKVEPCPTCRRAREAIHRFEEDFDYWPLVEEFDSLRAENPDPFGTKHLDRWQRDAALPAQEWEAAWEFRGQFGLLESGHRITFEDVINVRAQCRERSLSAADLHEASPECWTGNLREFS